MVTFDSFGDRKDGWLITIRVSLVVEEAPAYDATFAQESRSEADVGRVV